MKKTTLRSKYSTSAASRNVVKSLELSKQKISQFHLNFLVGKFCWKTQFLHSLGQFARNYAETVPFHKIFTPVNYVKLRWFLKCVNLCLAKFPFYNHWKHQKTMVFSWNIKWEHCLEMGGLICAHVVNSIFWYPGYLHCQI